MISKGKPFQIVIRTGDIDRFKSLLDRWESFAEKEEENSPASEAFKTCSAQLRNALRAFFASANGYPGGVFQREDSPSKKLNDLLKVLLEEEDEDLEEEEDEDEDL